MDVTHSKTFPRVASLHTSTCANPSGPQYLDQMSTHPKILVLSPHLKGVLPFTNPHALALCLTNATSRFLPDRKGDRVCVWTSFFHFERTNSDRLMNEVHVAASCVFPSPPFSSTEK